MSETSHRPSRIALFIFSPPFIAETAIFAPRSKLTFARGILSHTDEKPMTAIAGSIAIDEGAIAIAGLISPVMPEWFNPVSRDFADEKRDDEEIVNRKVHGVYLGVCYPIP